MGCGLRWGELAGLELGDVAQREGRWAIVDLVGKHGRVRTVPMPSWAFAALDEWAAATGISSGPVLRPVSKGGLVGDGPITAQTVFETVIRYARLAGLGKITPHDLRHTFAKLAHQGHAPLEQIQLSLGHASIQTTERYLGLSQNLHDVPCDRLGIRGWEREDKGTGTPDGLAAGSVMAPTEEITLLSTGTVLKNLKRCNNLGSSGVSWKDSCRTSICHYTSPWTCWPQPVGNSHRVKICHEQLMRVFEIF